VLDTIRNESGEMSNLSQWMAPVLNTISAHAADTLALEKLSEIMGMVNPKTGTQEETLTRKC